MSDRTAKLAPAILAVFFASLTPTMLNSAAQAVENCLSGPKNQTPPGSHWYYRIDHATKRQCWYLADERDGPSRAAQRNLPASPPSVSSRKGAAQTSIADARAEWPMPQTRVEAGNRDEASAAAKPADTPPRIESSQGASIADATVPGWTVASRWPDPSASTVPAVAAPTKADQLNNVEPASSLPPPLMHDAGQATGAEQAPVTASYSARLQLATVIVALAIAGIAGGVIFRIVGLRGSRSARIRARRGAIWERTDDDSISLSSRPHASDLARRGSFGRYADPATEREDRVAAFYSHISKQAAS
jgi:hypothetical protein